ncbi:MAG TPA: VWA domain-containing protein [Candidatus Acidoferrum sp.]|nr:VWA domain-containing protein [Candidatus Acidoferrum sp.]
MTRPLSALVFGLLLSCFFAVAASAQENKQSPRSNASPLTVRSNLVLVPALVKDRGGETVFSLTADDFTLTDNGIPQPLQLESDTDSLPLALVVIVETGGEGAARLNDYRDLGPILHALIGDVQHRVAVVAFDSAPRLVEDFTPNTMAAANTISSLHKGDQGAAILDALSFGIDLLRKQPPEYRHVVLLFGETEDRGSRTGLDEAVRAVDDTNTAIYSFAFSTTKAAVKHEGSKLPRPGGTPYTDTPYGPGGCMSRAPDADPDAQGKRSVQALDCASDLLPPIRLVRMAFLAARDGFQRNIPESVAKLTGGEYFSFKNGKTLTQEMLVVSNDIPNYYVLSFRPQSPLMGFHSLDLRLKSQPKLLVWARKAYWVDDVTSGK